MSIVQRGEFRRAYKKLSENQLDAVNSAIEQIINNRLAGALKRGDLAGFRVHKFEVLGQSFLLAYELDQERLTLCALGPDENIYPAFK